MLWGYFEKMWIADRAAILVDQVYQDYRNYSSGMLVFATVLFAVQIYCDFGGYSHIAIGAAKVLGIRLMDNFRQPYFAVNCREFWRRWHISLSSWFRDYLYFPLGGSRGSSGRTAVNLMITFLVSGLWHGAGWHYVVWGAIHGSYQVAGRGIRYVLSLIHICWFSHSHKECKEKHEQGVNDFCTIVSSYFTCLLYTSFSFTRK